MRTKFSFSPFFVFITMWLAMAIWQQYQAAWQFGTDGGFQNLVVHFLLLGGLPLPLILSRTRNTKAYWLVEPKRLFAVSFPMLPCVVLTCLTAAFLYTVRIFNGLINTYVFFHWYGIASSVCAGVMEEFFFRACIFGRTEPALGFWPAALINGALFTLYHYPELLFGGSFFQLISLRAALIFVMGVVFCGMFQKWRCITLCMVIHTVWDILSFLFCVG